MNDVPLSDTPLRIDNAPIQTYSKTMQTQHYPTIKNWDDAYENGAHIDNGSQFPPLWNKKAAAFREQLGSRAELDIPYGQGERQTLDLFRPEGEAKGLLVFVHGGYWKAFDKSTWSHLAQGAVAQGWAVAMPSYTLAPQTRLTKITREISTAITHAAGLVDGPIHLAGHSAGGHLVTRMLCDDVPLALTENLPIQQRIKKVISISGVHDLRPLLNTSMNSILKLDQAEANTESVVLLQPKHKPELVCLVGGCERPEFIRQSALLAMTWVGFGVETRLVVDEDKHHFDIIEALESSELELFL